MMRTGVFILAGLPLGHPRALSSILSIRSPPSEDLLYQAFRDTTLPREVRDRAQAAAWDPLLWS